MIGAGANIHALDSHGRTPFSTMLESKNWELLDYMRSQGAQIHEQDLTWASDYYQFDIQSYLANRSLESEITGTGE